MIRNRFDCKVEIKANCGVHNFGKFDLTLVRCVVTYAPGTEQESARERYHFAELLKADGGEQEVLAAVKAAPIETKTEAILKGAIDECKN